MRTKIISTRKLKETISTQFSYSTSDAEVLMKYLETSKLMTLSMLILQDEPTEACPKPEKIKHLTMCITEQIDQLREEDFKMIELEFSQYEMNDALEEMERLRREYEEEIKALIND